jgi:molybdopterin-guanine dinucleotide biosynthesis protein A
MGDAVLAILAGGEGSRMGSPKAELRLGGRPILSVLRERFDWPGATLLVTAPGREHPPGWEDFDEEVLDPEAGQGPLRGVLTALENAAAGLVVVTAVDMPRVTRAQLEWVLGELRRRPDAVGVMPMQRRGEVKQVQPFPSAFRVEAAPLVRDLLAHNRRSLHGLLNDLSVVAVDAPAGWGQEVWTNLNTPEDVDALGG